MIYHSILDRFVVALKRCKSVSELSEIQIKLVKILWGGYLCPGIALNHVLSRRVKAQLQTYVKH
jgi:hypothetical protein